MKSTVFNLIILDESGSMGQMTEQTISGCNETLNTIRHSAKEHADSINSFISIFAFQDGGPVKSRYLVKNVRPEDVKPITDADYQPYGNTPLLDAVGSTLTELKAIADTHEDSTGIVTIMTDGYENSSSNYNWKQVAALISQLKELGWTINLIGANIDVNRMARAMDIDSSNAMQYSQTSEGTKRMWNNFNASVSSRYADEGVCAGAPCSKEEKVSRRKAFSKRFFNKDSQD
ncbi:MAG: hypothetical protein K2N05_06195 [Muribaculaceae bacterium]|nr:hypothetical protein [Muribaculaceae bacterium]